MTSLLEGCEGYGTESGKLKDADSWLYQVTSGILRDMPVKPAVRAAAYEVLAGLDRVRSLGEVTEARGRTGQGRPRRLRGCPIAGALWLAAPRVAGVLSSVAPGGWGPFVCGPSGGGPVPGCVRGYDMVANMVRVSAIVSNVIGTLSSKRHT